MSSIASLNRIDFPKHAAAAVKVDRLRDMIVVEAEHLADPEGEILAQLEQVTIAVKAMFGRKGPAH